MKIVCILSQAYPVTAKEISGYGIVLHNRQGRRGCEVDDEKIDLMFTRLRLEKKIVDIEYETREVCTCISHNQTPQTIICLHKCVLR